MSKLSGCHVRSMPRTRLSRHLVTTIMPRYLRAIYTRANWILIEYYRITSIRSDQAHLFHLHHIMSSLLPRCYCHECLPSAVVPRSSVHFAAVPWRLAHPLYSPATPSSSTVGWNVTMIVMEIREERSKERNRNGKRDGGVWSGGVEKIAIRNRMLIYFTGISFGDSILTTIWKTIIVL